VAQVTSFRTPLIALATGALGLGLTLTACGGSENNASSERTSTVTDLFMPPGGQTPSVCPSSAPTEGGEPEWTLPGSSGSLAVIGSTDTAAPSVTVKQPFKVTQTQVHTLKAGDGPVVADSATVTVCYMGVNGRDGSVFDSSYQRGEPVEFGLNRVVPGFQKAIAGQKVGSTVAVAMVPADGYPEGQPAAGILPGDTLVFAIKILKAR